MWTTKPLDMLDHSDYDKIAGILMMLQVVWESDYSSSAGIRLIFHLEPGSVLYMATVVTALVLLNGDGRSRGQTTVLKDSTLDRVYERIAQPSRLRFLC